MQQMLREQTMNFIGLIRRQQNIVALHFMDSSHQAPRAKSTSLKNMFLRFLDAQHWALRVRITLHTIIHTCIFWYVLSLCRYALIFDVHQVQDYGW